MNASQLRPIQQLISQFGVKSVLYGPPGSGKTPMSMSTAPRPVMCAVEPGLLSLRNSSAPAWIAPDYPRMLEFVDWLTSSAEAKQFDTAVFDSGSQMGQNIVDLERSKNHKDKRMMWYEAQLKLWGMMNRLYMMPQKHIVIIAKEFKGDNGERGPSFPSRAMTSDTAHLFDEVLRMEKLTGHGGVITPAIRCLQGHDLNIEVRDRSLQLAQWEPADLTQLFNKAMSNNASR